MANHSEQLRHLPQVSRVLSLSTLSAARERYPAEAITEAVRGELDALRQQILQGKAPETLPEPEQIAEAALVKLARDAVPRIRSVINATGVVLHTNLGRSPLAESAAQAAYEAARGYLNLELDLTTGKRSSRQLNVRAGLCQLTGAESATVVNNCAAATVIVLRTLAAGKEVIVSRGQLIEIGGSFRIPDILTVSGATLREVGTTNMTRLSDYEAAIGPNTGLLMKIHTSNYRVRGFTKAVEIGELVALGRKHGLPVIDDAGSGAALDLGRYGLPGEPRVTDGIAAGADLVLFSGDKLLGGPQAGIIAGRQDLIQRIERDPLMRAFRLDKMTLAALEATLQLYRDPERVTRELPTLRMLTMPLAELRQRSEAFAKRLRALPGGQQVEILDDVAYVGGGSLPDQTLPTVVIALTPPISEETLAARLRAGTPAVMGRVQDGRVLLDLRTVLEHQEEALFTALAAALAPSVP
ncbi:MAG: L-seryl-tRNA(Sec) selenium transferase [Bacteroidales bacterium]|nr:L-seryl-tRNA(Sec) selenium transferase [Bacteroidales bacterium]